MKKTVAKKKKQVHAKNSKKSNTNINFRKKSKKVQRNITENMEPNHDTVLELMTKYPDLNQTFEYILYSNKYKHSISDVYNIIKMLMSKLDELQKHNVDLKNNFEAIDFNYKIKGLIQSTSINLSHVIEQLNTNESTFLNFARNFMPSRDMNGRENTLENTIPNFINAPVVSEEPLISETSVSNFPMSSYISPTSTDIKTETSNDIKTENLIDQLNTNIFGSHYTIVLSSEDELDELDSNDLHRKQSSTKTSKPIKIEVLESYAIGSDFTDISSDNDNTSHDVISSPRESQDSIIPKLPSKPKTPTQKVRITKGLVSDEIINEARKSDLRLKKRLNERNSEMLKIINQLHLKPQDIVLEFDIVEKKPLITIHKELAKVLKKHQVEGIRFLWNIVFETMDKTNNTDGTGCILAHRMGIGKTLQIITLIYTILCHVKLNIKTFLIICPPGLIYNWMDEIYKWLKDIDNGEVVRVYDLPKTNKLYNITNIATWKSKGGVLILSYENFKALVNCNQNDLREAFSHTLINPGPDVVILDEGHYIKNTNTKLLKSLIQIRTKRRIVLTGTPMQNSLKEYYTMVNFVKPNILGNFGSFNSTFIKPIDSGQFIDSSDEAVELMKQRTFILHKLLQNTVHRIDDRNLKPLFTEKVEYIIEINMTEFQCELYEKFLHFNKISNGRSGVFLRLHVLTLITLHPLTLYRLIRFKNSKHSELGTGSIDEKISKDLAWITKYGEDPRFFEAKQSNKITFLLKTIDECIKRNEKLLCFLKSPVALDALEYFLQKENNWVEGTEYFRMDGKTPMDVRNQMCEAFNNPDNPTKLFILSLGTGVLGYNMVGANRVLLLSTSWNPSNDLQAIYRCLRFGQKKTVYVNRVLAKGSVEPKAYYRQISKLGMASSVVDFQHVNRKVSYDQTNDLFTFNASKKYCTLVPNTKDPVLNQLIRCNFGSISDLKEHDSMLVESMEDQMTVEERKALWLSFRKNELEIKSSSKSNIKTSTKTPRKSQVKQNKTNNTTHVNTNTRQDLDTSSISTNNFLPQTSSQSTNEIFSPRFDLHFKSRKPSELSTPLREHCTKSTANVEVSDNLNNRTYFKNNSSADKRNHWKNEEPIQNQFRNFQHKNFSHHKRYSGFHNRPHPFRGTSSKNTVHNEHQQSSSNYYPNKSWRSNNYTSYDNNFKNRSGMSK